jgi:hypothetical protein
MRVRGVLVGLLGVVLAHAVGAQQTLIPIRNRTYVGINPLGVPFEIFTAEIESGVAQGITLGGTVSHIDVDNDRYTSADFKFRYYPGDVVLRGFSIGANLGFLRYSNVVSDSAGSTRQSLDTPVLGLLTDYNWMLGSQGRLLIGTGLGAERILASAEDRKRVDIERARLTARFIIGIAF